MHTVGLVLHPQRDSAEAVDAILGWAERRGVQVLGVGAEIQRLNCAAVPVTPDELAERSDLLVSLGGDGTMLRAMRLCCGTETPVLGVNVGKLGFLAEIDPPELGDALSAIDEHRSTVEPRSAVQASFHGQQTIAFNDVDLARIPGRGSAAVVELTVSAGGSTLVTTTPRSVAASMSTLL